MDKTISTLKVDLQQAKKALTLAKKEASTLLAQTKASAKLAMEQEIRNAYAQGMKKALTELDTLSKKQAKILDEALKAAVKIEKTAGKPKLVAVKTKSTLQAAPKPKTGTEMKAEKPVSKLAMPKPSALPSQANRTLEKAATTLHEKRLGILEREFSPVKPIQNTLADENVEAILEPITHTDQNLD